MKRKELIKEKKPHQLKLSSMSLNYLGGQTMKSGKHHSQIIQKWKRKVRKAKFNSSPSKK